MIGMDASSGAHGRSSARDIVQRAPIPQRHGGFSMLLLSYESTSARERPEIHDADALNAAVAHVFNEFGFFPNGSAAEAQAEPELRQHATLQVVRRSAGSWGEPPGAVLESPFSSALAGTSDLENAPFPAEFETGRSGEVSTAPGFRLESDCSGANRPADTKHAVNVPGAVAERAPAEVTQISKGAAEISAGSTDQVCKPQRPHAHERIAFCVTGEGVQLIGRIPSLTEKERQRLLEALAELLQSHGLRLADATLNGKPVFTRSSSKE